jgi:uncharacterized protein (DUF169 family)
MMYNVRLMEKKMISLEEMSELGREIETLLLLRSAPIAIGLIKDEADIPKEAIRPLKDLGTHIALCQAFAMARRERKTVAMTKEDHWCWAPIIGYGLVEPPEYYLEGKTAHPHMVADLDSAKNLAKTEPRLPVGRCTAIVVAPLSSASIIADVVAIYGNSSQIRTILMAVKYYDGTRVISTFDPLDSCLHSVVATAVYNDYRIAFPDPGEYQRALAADDEVIFTLPIEKLPGLVTGLRHVEEMNHGYRAFTQTMRPDFPQPEFYKELFKIMGLS